MNASMIARNPAFLAEMKKIFFEAMMAGYASASKVVKTTIAELPGSKLIPPFLKGPWKVSDPYLVNAPLSSFSGGTTIIAYEGVPVWMMQYFGQYPEEAIPCLKAALRDAYSRKEFRGGRGPRVFEHEGLVYRNPPNRLGFEDFRGDEEIIDKHWKVLGWHGFQGGLML